MADMMQDSAAADPSAEPADDGSQGFEICIKVAADGSISVGVEDASEDEQGEDDSSYAPASGIKQALSVAMDIFKNQGQMPDDGGMDSMSAGYGKEAGPKQITAMDEE